MRGNHEARRNPKYINHLTKLKMKIAEALLLRKQLEAKVKQLEPLKLQGETGVYKTEVTRSKVNDNYDEIIARVARVELKDITSEYDHYATELRKLDTSIQKANWAFDVDYVEAGKPKVDKKK
jgi:hypothetical protein